MRVKLLKLELLDNPKVKVTADIQLGSLLVIHGIKLLRLDNGRMMVYMPSRPEGKEYVNISRVICIQAYISPRAGSFGSEDI